MADASKSSNTEASVSAANSSPRSVLPSGSSFNELFSGGRPVWLKIVGAAVAVPIATVVYGIRAARKSGSRIPSDPVTISMTLFGAAAVGALVGSALVMKDIVHRRQREGRHVSFPLRLLFGFGMVSVLLVWVPIGFLVAILCAMSVLLQL